MKILSKGSHETHISIWVHYRVHGFLIEYILNHYEAHSGPSDSVAHMIPNNVHWHACRNVCSRQHGKVQLDDAILSQVYFVIQVAENNFV